MQQAQLAVHRIHAYRIHFMYQSHDEELAMSPSSCFHVQNVGISAALRSWQSPGSADITNVEAAFSMAVWYFFGLATLKAVITFGWQITHPNKELLSILPLLSRLSKSTRIITPIRFGQKLVECFQLCTPKPHEPHPNLISYGQTFKQMQHSHHHDFHAAYSHST